MQFFYMHQCAFAHRATISVVACDGYPLKTVAIDQKDRRILQKLRLTSRSCSTQNPRFEGSSAFSVRIKAEPPVISNNRI
jgi:hypothetical protein